MFRINKKISKSLGRAGVLVTSHGEIQTPAFVAVGTKATIKSLTPEQVANAGSQIVLANTYHLYLEPGEKIIKKTGGLRNFMNWPGPIMTDSGGFQVFSLGVAYGNRLSKFTGIERLKPSFAKTTAGEEEKKARPLTPERSDGGRAKITENGVRFKSIIDGSEHFFTPEKSIQIQNNLGANIIFAFDECTSPHAPKRYLREAMERTHRWAERSLVEFKTSPPNPLSLPRRGGTATSSPSFLPSPSQACPQCLALQGGRGEGPGMRSLFGIVQGGRHEDLRKESARKISGLDFDGFGIGGSFVKEDMATAVKWVNEILPEEKPRHLLGVGEPIDLILGVENGCDTFDCVAPTRMARNGALYTRYGKINITNAKYKNLLKPIEEKCRCYTCQNYSTAYISHLFRAKEMLAATLATIHNLYFLNNLMSQIRQSILDSTFSKFKDKFLKDYK